jgi:glycine/D-amino acid oxidase-like deaminating enzyme
MDEPRTTVDIAIIGAGFSGLGIAIRLRRHGIDDFLVLERHDDVGGTWWANTYPGCACDVPSHLYSISFAPNPDWSQTYSAQPEIRAYLQRCASEHDLHRSIWFGTTVTAADWDDGAGRCSARCAPCASAAQRSSRSRRRRRPRTTASSTRGWRTPSGTPAARAGTSTRAVATRRCGPTGPGASAGARGASTRRSTCCARRRPPRAKAG